MELGCTSVLTDAKAHSLVIAWGLFSCMCGEQEEVKSLYRRWEVGSVMDRGREILGQDSIVRLGHCHFEGPQAIQVKGPAPG